MHYQNEPLLPMQTIRKILVPTDFSVRANAAFTTASQLARNFKAEVHLLHVLEVPQLEVKSKEGLLSQDGLMHFLEKAVEEVKLKTAELKTLFPSVKVHEHVFVDRVHNQIFSLIETLQIDLVVMGSSGAEGWEELLVGSNSQKVIRNASCPVLVIKNSKPLELKNVIYASDFENYTPSSIEFVKLLQAHYKSRLHLLTVITPKTFEASRTTVRRLSNFAVQHGLEHYETHAYNNFSEEEGIVAYAEDCKADLIVMCTHGRTGLARMLAGSIAENVANHSSVSVTTFRLI